MESLVLLIDSDILDLISSRELSALIRDARPVASDSEVEDDEEFVVVEGPEVVSVAGLHGHEDLAVH